MSSEELVAVNLGDDYYQGPYFVTKETDSSAAGDYLVPRSQLERWEKWLAGYGQMQDEVLAVMSEQRERVIALLAGSPKGPMAEFIEQAYAKQMTFALNASPLLRGANHQEPEGGRPRLVADPKIDHEEEERGL